MTMNNVKFRAWDSNAKAMFPVHEMNFDKINNQLQSIYGVDIYDKDSDYYGDVSYGGSIHKKTGSPGEPLRPKFELMQFTGLLDVEGKEIYDADFIKDDENFIWEVFHKRGAFYVKCDDLMAEQLLSSIYLFGNVIGNIYKHPELLGDSQ